MKRHAIAERLAVFKTKYFLVGFFVRIMLLFIGGGTVFEKYFIPFLDYFSQNPLANTWEAFAPEYFPYGLFPLIVVGLPKLIAFKLFGEISLGLTAFNFFLIKSVLLGFDTILFWILTRFTSYNIHRVTWFYWLNPIVIYISFVLGHFDIISMSLLVMCLFLIGKQHMRWAGFVGGLALSSKFQIALILPLIAAYFWNNNFRKLALRQLTAFFTPLVVVAALGFLPLTVAQHLSYSTLTSPEALKLFAAKISLGQDIDFVIGVALVLLALGRLVFSTRISFNGLIFGSGILLGCLVVTTNAEPGWYLWVLPFLALFFANYVTAPSLLFIVTAAVYSLHFTVMNSFTPFFRSLSFTVLQLGILVQLLVVYWQVLRHETQMKNRLRPMMLGLSGDSGAGKNHLCKTIQSLLDPNNCIIIEGDNYHKWERGDKSWEVFTHLNPSANNLLKMQDHANRIARGQPILHHHYDHGTGRFVPQPPTNPTKTIIFQGLHSLYLKSLRDILDLRIFLDPDEKVRTFWKIQRDVFERGHTLQKVLDSLAKRKADSKKHIQPQREKSDWVIEISTDEEFDPVQLNKESELPLFTRYILLNDEPISELVEELETHGLKVSIEFVESNLDRVVITVRGQLMAEQVKSIAWRLFPQMRHLTRASVEPQFEGGMEGTHQLFLLALLSKRVGA